MAYNTSRGKRDLGDIEYETDPDTQIDFGNDYIALKTDGIKRFAVSGATIQALYPLSCSKGVSLSGILSSSSEISASAFRGSARRVTFPIQTIATVYTASVRDYTILANTTTRNITVLLPSASVASEKIYNIKKLSSLNTLTITSSNGTIDGAATQAITSIYQSYTFHSNGSDWYII